MLSLVEQWQRCGVLCRLLWPWSVLFGGVVRLRRWLYQRYLLKVWNPRVPLIVVGNLTVGGSGKTPLVIWLAGHLQQQGWRPGIISRGYGGQASSWPQPVAPDSDPRLVGDETVLLAQRTGCPIWVGPDRPAAARAVLQHGMCDVLISDDGMQHYALGRDLEIAVVDGRRRFGNRHLLPAGPLREPLSRLTSVDLMICNGPANPGEFSMQLGSAMVYPLNRRDAARPLAAFDGQAVRAIAGIGHPQRFFDMLTEHGMRVSGLAFPDHHRYVASDLQFDDQLPLLMTEKDAVKCQKFAPEATWVVCVDAQPEAAFVQRFDQLLAGLITCNIQPD